MSAKQAELDDQAKKLATTDAFSQDLYKQIQNVAETEGYSLVINLKGSDTVMNSVLWYSPMIDITDDVIQALPASLSDARRPAQRRRLPKAEDHSLGGRTESPLR